MTKSKDPIVESVRGLACILLVSYHVIGITGDHGLRISDDSIIHYINWKLTYIRMPLFTFLSGVVYAYRPVRMDNKIKFAEGKFYRLVIPFVTVSTIFALTIYFTPGTNAQVNISELWKIYIFPFAHFWFLQALIQIFLLVAVLDVLRLLDKLHYILILLLLSFAIYYSRHDVTTLFSFHRAIYLLPYFLAGVIFTRFRNEIKIFCSTNILLIAICALFILMILNISLNLSEITEDYYYQLLLGILIPILLLVLGFRNKYLIKIGAYSYPIYLFHVFGTAGSRIILEHIEINSLAIQFPISVVSGLIFPIVLHYVTTRNQLLNMLLFGKKPEASEPKSLKFNLHGYHILKYGVSGYMKSIFRFLTKRS